MRRACGILQLNTNALRSDCIQQDFILTLRDTIVLCFISVTYTSEFVVNFWALKTKHCYTVHTPYASVKSVVNKLTGRRRIKQGQTIFSLWIRDCDNLCICLRLYRLIYSCGLHWGPDHGGYVLCSVILWRLYISLYLKILCVYYWTVEFSLKFVAQTEDIIQYTLSDR